MRRIVSVAVLAVILTLSAAPAASSRERDVRRQRSTFERIVRIVKRVTAPIRNTGDLPSPPVPAPSKP